MSDEPIASVVDLATVRAERDTARLLERRKAVPPGVSWTVRHTTVGGVAVFFELHAGEEAWEVTVPLTLEQSRQLGDDIDRAAFYARGQRDRHDGVVHLTWCAVDGRHVACPIFGGVPARVVGRVPGGVHLQLALALAPLGAAGVREPRYGWPRSGLYSLAMGAHVDTPPRRRHWRIVRSDLEALRAQSERG